MASTVGSVNGSAVWTARGGAPTWRLRQWPNDPSVVHLIFTDHLNIPSVGDLHDALETARLRGARAVRTSAMFPGAADVARAAGFQPIDHLALLRLDLRHAHPVQANHRRRTRVLRSWHHGRAAAVDQDAFGSVWGNDSRSITEIRDATPAHRSRWVSLAGEMAGFAISGAAGDNGYLQRLAVITKHRRQGIARDLVLDALDWMRHERLGAALVNTGIDNLAALSLYQGLGFTQLNDRLTIGEHRFIKTPGIVISGTAP